MGKKSKDDAGPKKSKGDGEPTKLKNKVYLKEMRKLQEKLCHLQEWVKFKGLRVIIIFEGRDDQSPHRTSQSSHFPGSDIAGTVGPREVANVQAALHAVFSGQG